MTEAPKADAGEALDLDSVRRQLEERRSRVVADLRRRAARLRDDGEPSIEEDDGVMDDPNLDASLSDLATATLRHIDRALARLDNGQYGWCIWCQRRIERVRLQVMPFAMRCRDCETTREAGRELS